MKDETYPPPPPRRPPRTVRETQSATAQPRKRAFFAVVSLVCLTFAFALNMTNNTNLISFKAKPAVLPAGTVEVAVKLQNLSAMELYVSRNYSLERLENGEWAEIASNDSTIFDPAVFYVGKFSGINLTFGSYGVFSALAPGEYRVAIAVFTPRTFLGSEHNLMLYAEFAVTEE